MRTIFLVYVGDAWLSHSSLDAIAVATTKRNAVKLVRRHARLNGGKLSIDDAACLESHNQTQGREYNYLISEVMKNELI